MLLPEKEKRERISTDHSLLPRCKRGRQRGVKPVGYLQILSHGTPSLSRSNRLFPQVFR